ncbi:MAG TPA: class I SAM-dependent methyltransferase [Chthoniobacterales bacterium]
MNTLTPSPTERYTPGYTPTSAAYMAERDVDSHGFFLTPLLESGMNLLDAGCGPGSITMGIAEQLFPGTVTALDISAEQLDHARRIAEGREIVNIRFACASAQNTPFEDASFDGVFSHALLEHLSEPIAALTEFRRLIRPGGFVAVCSPDWDLCTFAPYPREVEHAIRAYRDLQEDNGGNTRAGGHLGEWMQEAGLEAVSTGEWIEEHGDARRIAGYLARQLDDAGLPRHADTLRKWAQDPGATFLQCWKFAIGRRAAGDQS